MRRERWRSRFEFILVGLRGWGVPGELLKSATKGLGTNYFLDSKHLNDNGTTYKQQSMIKNRG